MDCNKPRLDDNQTSRAISSDASNFYMALRSIRTRVFKKWGQRKKLAEPVDYYTDPICPIYPFAASGLGRNTDRDAFDESGEFRIFNILENQISGLGRLIQADIRGFIG